MREMLVGAEYLEQLFRVAKKAKDSTRFFAQTALEAFADIREIRQRVYARRQKYEERRERDKLNEE